MPKKKKIKPKKPKQHSKKKSPQFEYIAKESNSSSHPLSLYLTDNQDNDTPQPICDSTISVSFPNTPSLHNSDNKTENLSMSTFSFNSIQTIETNDITPNNSILSPKKILDENKQLIEESSKTNPISSPSSQSKSVSTVNTISLPSNLETNDITPNNSILSPKKILDENKQLIEESPKTNPISSPSSQSKSVSTVNTISLPSTLETNDITPNNSILSPKIIINEETKTIDIEYISPPFSIDAEIPSIEKLIISEIDDYYDSNNITLTPPLHQYDYNILEKKTKEMEDFITILTHNIDPLKTQYTTIIENLKLKINYLKHDCEKEKKEIFNFEQKISEYYQLEKELRNLEISQQHYIKSIQINKENLQLAAIQHKESLFNIVKAISLPSPTSTENIHPTYLLLDLISHITIFLDLSDIFSLVKVNKILFRSLFNDNCPYFYNLSTSIPHFLNEIELSQSLILFQNITHLSLQSKHITDALVLLITSFYQSIQYLDLSYTSITNYSCEIIGQSYPKLQAFLCSYCPNITAKGLFALFQCPLEHLSFNGTLLSDNICRKVAANFPSIRYLSLDTADEMTDLGVLALIAGFEELHTLSFKKSHFVLSDTLLAEVLSLCPHLTSLSLNHCTLISNQTLMSIGKLNYLQYLSLSYSLSSSLSLQLLSSCDQIITLDLSYCQIEEQSLTALLPFLKHLQHLFLHSLILSDYFCLILSRNCHQLTSLDLTLCSGITDLGLDYLVKSCPNLTDIIVNYSLYI